MGRYLLSLLLLAASGWSQTITVTASAGRGGTISPAGPVSVAYGASQGFSITPNSGYTISNVTVDGRSIGKANSYAFTNVTAKHTIKATFSYRRWWW